MAAKTKSTRKTTQTNFYQKYSRFLPVMVFVVLIGGFGIYKLSFSSAAPVKHSCVNKTFKEGSRGACVQYIQNLLNYDVYGLDSGHYLPANGTFTPQVTNAVKSFQQTYKSSFPQYSDLTVDGVVDPADTWYIICNPQKGPAPDWFVAAYSAADCASAPGGRF